MNHKVKAAFVGFGEVNTSKEIIERKCTDAKKELEKIDIEVVVNVIVSDDSEENEVERTIKKLSTENFDFLILCIAGWMPSYTIISIASEFSYKPILLWGLSGYYKNEVYHTK